MMMILLVFLRCFDDIVLSIAFPHGNPVGEFFCFLKLNLLLCIACYAYGPFGRRISKTVHGETTYFIYTDEGLVAELNEGGDVTRAYGWELSSMYGTAPLWQAEVSNNQISTAQFHTLITDHLGTPQMAVNDEGTVTWKAVSESFGKTIANQDNQITMNLRFPGQYYDEEAGTHYNYFRDYNPNTGRYIQKDPIGLNAGINWFGYVGGNPLIYSDLFGLQALPSPTPTPQPLPVPQTTTFPQTPPANDPVFNPRMAGALISVGGKVIVLIGLLAWPAHLDECGSVKDEPDECWDNRECDVLAREIEARKGRDL